MGTLQFLRIISVAGAFLAGAWVPMRWIGYLPPPALEIIFDFFISIASIINVYIYFKTTQKNPKQFSSWLNIGLGLDLLCVFPLSVALFYSEDPSLIWVLSLNVFSARHVNNIRPFLDGFPSLKPVTYRLVPLILFLPLMVHLIASGWIYLGNGTAGIEGDPVLNYVRAFYWTLTTLTTVGYGDISAKTIPQMFYACATQITGVGVFGFIISNVAGILARSDAAREHHMDNLDKVETFLNHHKVSGGLRHKIRQYYHYVWIHKKGYQDSTLLSDLPKKIQSELIMQINQSIVEKVPFLKGADEDFLEELMLKIETRILTPKEKIFKAGEDGDALYIVHKGSVDILTAEGNHIATLGEGAFFGEIALISDKPRSATAISHEFCEVYQLKKVAFQEVVNTHPHFKGHLEEIMKDRAA